MDSRRCVLFPPLLLLILGFGSSRPVCCDENSEPIARARALAAQGEFDQALFVVRERLSIVPQDSQSRDYLARLLFEDGRYDEAVEVWEAGLDPRNPNWELVLHIGSTRLQQAKDGPNLRRRRDSMTFHRVMDAEAEKRYRREHYEQALKSMLEVRRLIKKDVPQLSAQIVEIQTTLEDYAGAEATVRESLSKHPDDPELLGKLAAVQQAAGREQDAVDTYFKVAQVNPRDGQARIALAKYFESQDGSVRAAGHWRQANFYRWLAPFASIDYDDANYAIFCRLVSAYDEEPQDEEIVAARRLQAIKELSADGSPTAMQFLAVVCWRHDNHGPLENMAFRGLETNPAGRPLLRTLLADHKSTCTARAAAMALARLKDADAYELMIPLLDKDIRSNFDMNIAGALAVLGDPRAVAPLIQRADVAQRQVSTYSLLGLGGGDPGGVLAARCRAILALGTIDTSASRAALAEGLRNPQVELPCHAALYLLTKDDAELTSIEAGFKTADPTVCFVTAVGLYDSNEPAAATVAQRWYDEREERRKNAERQQPPRANGKAGE